MSYIYCITNNVNNKQYIGKTNLSIEKRFKEHCNDSIKERCDKRPLYEAMRKYGIQNFSIKEILWCEPEYASFYESFFIRYFNTYGHNGYNATMGGDGSNRYSHEEIIELIKLGYSVNQISERVGCCKDLIYDIANNNHIKLRRNGCRIIGQYDLENNLLNVFLGIGEAKKWLLENHITSNVRVASHIEKCCKGERKTCLKYIWKYLPSPE